MRSTSEDDTSLLDNLRPGPGSTETVGGNDPLPESELDNRHLRRVRARKDRLQARRDRADRIALLAARDRAARSHA